MESSLHTLDPCLLLLLTNLMNKDNMSMSALEEIGERSAQEGVIHRVSFNIVSVAKWEGAWSHGQDYPWSNHGSHKLWKNQRLLDITRSWVTTPITQEVDVQQEETLWSDGSVVE